MAIVDDPSVGYRVLPHTADLILEAWAPTWPVCLEQAVAALTAVFADVEAAEPTGRVEVDIPDAAPTRQLVALLEEVVCLADADGLAPVAARVAGDAGSAALDVVRLADVEVIGAAPKAVARSGLAAEEVDGRWRCRAIIDV